MKRSGRVKTWFETSCSQLEHQPDHTGQTQRDDICFDEGCKVIDLMAAILNQPDRERQVNQDSSRIEIGAPESHPMKRGGERAHRQQRGNRPPRALWIAEWPTQSNQDRGAAND